MILLWLGCATEGGDCLERYPVIGEPTADALTVERSCETAGGTGCNAESFISADAASCLAERAGLAEGLASWVCFLGYSAEARRPVWTVSNTLEPGAGELLRLDAVTGSVLERAEWQ